MLALLLVEANRPVPVDHIVDRVWARRKLPRHPRRAVQHAVTLLRQALTPATDVAITRDAIGYTLTADPDAIDLHRFGALLGQARAATRDEQAGTLFELALGLWQGEPFAGLDVPWLDALRTTLSARLQAARLDLTDIHLRQGRHAALLAELADQTTHHPLDERLAGQYVLALYRSGRQAQALAYYRRVRTLLADELGADPGAALQELHQRILTADPTLAVPTPAAEVPAAAPSAAPRQPVPRQLPAPPRLFTGRTTELARLDAALDERADAGGTVVISAIGGTGGIGKTWLALHWAHRRLDRFPDGQLHANLRGFDPTGRPVPAATAVRGFLDALGVSPAAIPADPEAQAGLYRSLVADKRMLIVLDNARDAGQVIPLLPGSPSCTVLVTSRHHLGGLVTAHGAQTLDLDVLDAGEARRLVTRHLGRQRVTAEPEAVADLLDYCAGLPLALGIVAARATRHPRFPLAALAAELRDQSRRLDALDPGDPDTTPRAVLSWSLDALSEAASTAFGLLSLAPGPDIALPAAASLLAQPTPTTQALLRELEDAHLLQQHAPGRYRMHDLVRLYATERADHDRTSAEREAAVRRVLDFYVHTAHTADRLLAPHRPTIRLDPPTPGTHPHKLPDALTALAWLELEHSNLTAAQQVATTRTQHTTVWQLAWILTTFHYRRGQHYDELAMWRAAQEAAAHLPDPTIRARARRFLGTAYASLGRHQEAAEHLHRALAIAEHHHDSAEQAYTHQQLSWAWGQQGDDRQALHHAVRTLDLFRTLDRPVWQAQAHNMVGWHSARLGDYRTARTHCLAALALHHDRGNPNGEAATLDSLGYIEHRTGHHQQAIGRYQQALTLYRALDNAYCSADVLEHLGHPHAALGQHEHARAAWRQALELYRAQHRDADAARVQEQLRDSAREFGEEPLEEGDDAGGAVDEQVGPPR